MRLNEKSWIYGGGITPEWKWIFRRRTREALAGLKAAAKDYPRRAPPAAFKRAYLRGLSYVIESSGPERDAILSHPALDYWLFLWDKHFAAAPRGPEDWSLHFGLFQGFAAALALKRGASLRLEGLVDPSGRLALYGSPLRLDYPASAAGKTVPLALGKGRLEAGGKTARPCEEILPGIEFEDRAWLIAHGVTMHGLAHPEGEARERFCAALRKALSDMEARAPGLFGEFRDMVRVIIPLENSMGFGSVSSSYVNLRGAICLSHSGDPLLQAETLIHEFCHQKINQLLVAEPLLLPGQGGQVFYSPWRPDARRLRGLLLGAHAFLNVAGYLLSAVSNTSYREKASVDSMLNVAQRLFQVETALRSLAFYGAFTEFGREFLLGMWRELGFLFHGMQWFPPALVDEARENCLKHRKEHSLFDTGFHKSAEFEDKVGRAPFLSPGGSAAAAAPLSVEAAA
ncbi:MAG: hypothetical protein HY921_02335 [Elusimicrobia bacterium]|nr:hypothetical protein [Elusimicrobiota bacterium]